MGRSGLDDDFVELAHRVEGGGALDQGELLPILYSMLPDQQLLNVALHWRCFAEDDAKDLLADVWCEARYPWRLGATDLVEVFRGVGFVADTPGLEPPTSPLTVYRSAGSSGRWFRLSWTTDEEKAGQFVDRPASKKTGDVFRAEIPPEDVLADLRGRGNSEVVVDPRRLRKRRLLRPPEGSV